jgi:DNA polymerase I-like protein with 3'-5' exonuclease and polymerase domains
MAFQTIPKHGPFAKAIRGIFIPPPGYVFVEADLSQAEARIVAILADDEYTLNLFNTTDIHSQTASWIFGCDPKVVTSDQRFIGKVCRHAGNYGEGKRTLMLSANSDAKKFGIPLQISEKEAESILTVFHTRTPKIRRVFQSEVKIEVGKTRTLFNPFGRMRQFFGHVKETEAYAQIPQSTVPDHIRMAGLRIRGRLPKIRICAETHDALLFKLREDSWETEAKIIKEEFEVPIDFSRCSLPREKLIIPAEIQVGKRYSELKKVKI